MSVCRLIGDSSTSISKCFGFRFINPQWKLANTINNKLYYVEDNVLPFSDHIRDLGIYHDTRLKYDHISLIVHKAYTHAVLILKCFHTRDPSTRDPFNASF